MASDGEHGDLTAQLRAIERGEAAPWARDRPVTWWFPPVFGVISALLVLTTELVGTTAFYFVFPCLIGLSWVATYLNRRQRGPVPSGTMPREFARSVVLYLVAAVASMVTVFATIKWFGTWPGAAVALVLGWLLMAWSERADARAAVRVRNRLS